MSKLGIIVPYRDRKEHLDSFLPSISTYLNDRDINYQVYIVEQTDTEPFNRGALLNLGAKRAIEDGCDRLCFHDVDLIPVDVDYEITLKGWPVELVKTVRGEKQPAYNYFGGAALVSPKTYQDVNGYSNRYEGWGFEDDDFFLRLVRKEYATCMTDFVLPATYGKGLKLPTDRISLPCTLPEKGKRIIIIADFIPRLPSVGIGNRDMKVLTISTGKGTECSISYDRYEGYRFEIWDSGYRCHHLCTEKQPTIHSRVLVELDLENKEFCFYHNGIFYDNYYLEDPRRTFAFSPEKINIGFSERDDSEFEGVLLEAGMLYVSEPLSREQGEQWSLTAINFKELPKDTEIFWYTSKKDKEHKMTRVTYEGLATVPVPCKPGKRGTFDHLYHERTNIYNGSLSRETIKNQERYYKVFRGEIKENEGLSNIEDLYSTEISEYQENVTWIKAIKK